MRDFVDHEWLRDLDATADPHASRELGHLRATPGMTVLAEFRRRCVRHEARPVPQSRELAARDEVPVGINACGEPRCLVVV